MEWLKKQKNAFSKCVLEFNFAPISGPYLFIFQKKSKSMYPNVHVPCALYRPYRLYRVLQGPGKSLRLISPGLSNKVYNLNVYMLQSLYLTKLINNRVYK
jgi:hypothetical protein